MPSQCTDMYLHPMLPSLKKNKSDIYYCILAPCTLNRFPGLARDSRVGHRIGLTALVLQFLYMINVDDIRSSGKPLASSHDDSFDGGGMLPKLFGDGAPNQKSAPSRHS